MCYHKDARMEKAARGGKGTAYGNGFRIRMTRNYRRHTPELVVAEAAAGPVVTGSEEILGLLIIFFSHGRTFGR